MDDGLLEVVGLGGPTHETSLRLYLSYGHRLAQGARITIRIKHSCSLPMAVCIFFLALLLARSGLTMCSSVRW
jgi:hypothetical protein